MKARSKTFRIFVSSTFHDLKAERDALQEKVFPRLRRLCEQHGARFQAIDLRWGVSEEASLDQQTMNICLSEIERCQKITPRPNFIALLGDRYGWCPPPPQVPAAEFEQILTRVHDPSDRALLQEWYALDENAVPPECYLLPRTGDMTTYENWEPVERDLQRTLAEGARRLGLSPDALAMYNTSATEQEIVKGLFGSQDARNHVFGFFRSIEGFPDDERAGAFVDLNQAGRRDTQAAKSLHDLKTRLDKVLPGNVRHYRARWMAGGITLDHLDQLAEDVYQCLAKAMRAEIERPSRPVPSAAGGHHIDPHQALDEEGLAHHGFAEERLAVFVGRTDSLETIKDYVAGADCAVLSVSGAGGTGKSSLMAKAIQQAHLDHPAAQVIYRFIGTTPDSSTLQSLLESLCRELGRRYETGDKRVPSEYHQLVTDFGARLSNATAARPLILFLDALDQLSPDRAARSLAWVPDPLPPRVRMILSTRPGDMGQSLGQRQAHPVHLGAMSPTEGDALLRQWLKAADRTLQERQTRSVLEKFNQSSGTPLYLKLAFEEARRWKSGTGEPPEQLAPGIPGIIRHNLLARLAKEDNHGETLVSHVLGYLAASRYGLAEDELLDLLSRDPQVYAWFLRSVFHTPQDILTAALEYLRGRGHPFPEPDGVPFHDEEAAVQRWLDGVRANDQELDAFLAEVLTKPRGPRLPVVLWSRLYFDLQPFLSSTRAEGSALLGFFHRELGEVAAEQYLSGGQEVPYHVRMADYFRAMSDPSGTRVWDGNAPRGLSELPYHLVKGTRWDDACDILTDLKFIQAKTESLGPQPLIADYDQVQRAGRSDPSSRVIREALQLSAHVLADDPSQVASQLTGRLLLSDLQPIRRLLEQALDCGQPWLRPLTTALIRPGGPLLRTLVGHRGPVDHVAFDPDGKHIISRSGDGTVRIWDPETGDALRVITDREAVDRVWLDAEREGLLQQDPNQRLSVRSDHDVVHIQDASGATLATLIGHNHEVRTWAFSPDGTKLATGGQDHTVRVWDLTRRHDEQTLEHPGGVTTVAAAQQGSRAVSGGGDGTLRVWDLNKGGETARLLGHSDRINALAVSRDGQRALSASADATLKVWDLVTGVELLSLSGHQGGVRALAMTADGRHALSAGADQTLKAWDLATGRERASVEGPQSWEPAIAISPNGRLAAAAYRDRTVRVWDLDRSALMATCIGHINAINAVAFSPDGCHIISGGDDQSVRVWDATSGIEQSTLLGHWDSVRVLDITADGLLVSLSRDDTVRVWDCNADKELRRLGGRKSDPSGRSHHPSVQRTGVAPSEPSGISTTADGKRAVSFYINADTLRLWDLERGVQIAAFTGDNILACCAAADDDAILAGTKNGQVHILRLQGTNTPPVSSSLQVEAKTTADTTTGHAPWRVEPAGIEKVELVDSGAISFDNLETFSVYRLIHPLTEQLAQGGGVTLSGDFICSCGNRNRLKATIRFGGFLNWESKYNFFCESHEDNIGCNRDMMLVGETTQSDRGTSYWLLLKQMTGPPGMVLMPGTAEGLPQLRFDKVEGLHIQAVPPSETKHVDSSVGEHHVESAAHKPFKVRTEFDAGDVLAMAIIYEGHVVVKPNRIEIAQELLTYFSKARILEGVHLHPYTAIRMRRADEAAYWEGSYEPVDELPQMLEKGIIELGDRLKAKGQGLGRVATRLVTLKGQSKIVSTCWIALHILQTKAGVR